jgi:hypothetical protein
VLNAAVDGFGWALHDRRGPGTASGISHLVVVPTGVWVIDSLDDDGPVERREAAGSETEHRLFIGGLDRTDALDRLHRAHAAVVELVEDEAVPVNQMLVLPHGEFRLLSRAFRVRGAWCSPPRDMVKRVSRRGGLRRPQLERLAWVLAAGLPATT